MPKISLTGVDSTIKALERMEKSTDSIFEDAIKTGAGIFAGEIRKRLEQNLDSPRSASSRGGKFDRKKYRHTGELLGAFGISPVLSSKNGGKDVKIGFGGYDTKGVPNTLKARVMESGSSTIRKRPFFRPGIRAAQKKALAAARHAVEDGLAKKKEGK